jgi:hypothetical protein
MFVMSMKTPGHNKHIEIPDTSANRNGAAGGPNGRGKDLSPVIYPTEPIDVSDGKITCGKRPCQGQTVVPRIVQKMNQVKIFTN